MKDCFLPAAGALAVAIFGWTEIRCLAGGLQPQGAEYQLTRGVPGDQVRPRLGLHARGGWLVWQDAAIDGNGLGIAATRLGAGGSAPQGAPFPVNATVAGDQENPALACLPDGGALVVWQGGVQGFQKVFARLLGPDGLPRGVDLAVSTGNGEHHIDPSVAVLADGSLVVVWASYRQDGSYSYDVFGRRLSAEGTPLSEEFRLNSATGMNRRSPAVTGLAGGGFLCAWVAERQLSTQASIAPGLKVSGAGLPVFEVSLVARTFTTEGSPVGSEQRISNPGAVASHPALATLPSGQVLAAWSRRDSDATRKLDVAARLVGPQGLPASEEAIVNQTLYGDQYAPVLAVNPHGVLAIWTSMGQDGSWEGVFGRWLDATGTPSGDEIPVNGQIGGGQIFPSVASGPDNNLVVAWSSNLPRVGYEVFAQRLAPLLLRAEHSGTGRMRLSWPTVAGGLYQLQVSRDGRTWVEVGGGRAAASDSDSTEIPAAGQVVLYRVVRVR